MSNENIQITKPLGYLDFLSLLSNSKLLLTDSGGVQEEAITLNIPCVTLRYNTERPETITNGGNILAGADSEEISNNIKNILNNPEVYEKMAHAANPYGDGQSSKKIYDILKETYENNELVIKKAKEILDFKGYHLYKITKDITVKDYENENQYSIIQQVFHENNPENVEDNLKLKNKIIIVKEFEKNN